LEGFAEHRESHAILNINSENLVKTKNDIYAPVGDDDVA